ncbi:hypothetical protein FBQ98_11920 [Gammaproteobacteria bacterium PRO6]|nr:hypothetical protein [Gammaproteobacteria bacterium PRO6]
MTAKPSLPQWYGGYDNECAWIQFGINPDWIISIVRCWDTPSIEIAIHILDAESTNLNIPGYAPFSIEAGADEATATIDGIGTIEQRSGGNVVFGAGNMDFDDPYSLFVMRRWLALAKPPLAIHIGQLSLTFPIDSSIFSALSVLTTKQRHFRNAVHNNTFYVQDET